MVSSPPPAAPPPAAPSPAAPSQDSQSASQPDSQPGGHRTPPPARGQVRVLIWFAARADDDAPAIRQGYAAMRDGLRGRRGLIRSELLESLAEPGSFAVLSHWESMGDFVAWQREPGHDGDTAPMDGYLDRGRPGGSYAQAFTVTDEG